MADDEYSLRYYVKVNGKRPFEDWLLTLWDSDRDAAARVQTRLDRLRLGSFGDSHGLKGGLSELRIAVGPGYRVYFIREGRTTIILLCGGDKSTQKKDIARARDYAADYRRRADARKRII